MKGEFPFTMGRDGISVFALGAMRLTQRSSNIRISSGVKDPTICGGGYFQDSIILATGLLVQVNACIKICRRCL